MMNGWLTRGTLSSEIPEDGKPLSILFSRHVNRKWAIEITRENPDNLGWVFRCVLVRNNVWDHPVDLAIVTTAKEAKAWICQAAETARTHLE